MRKLLYKSYILGTQISLKFPILYPFLKGMYKVFVKPVLSQYEKKIIKLYGGNIIKILHNYFESENIEYFVAFGTLLGFIRDKNFIPYDTDIDLILVDLKKTLKLPPIFKKIQEIYINNSLALIAYEFKGIRIDIFLATRINNFIICYDFPNKPNTNIYELIIKEGGLPVRQFIFPYTGRKEYELKFDKDNIITYIPNEWKDFLEIVYGKDFWKPNPQWNALNIKHPNVKILPNKKAIVKFF